MEEIEEDCEYLELVLSKCRAKKIKESKCNKEFAFVVSDGKQHALLSADSEVEMNKV